MKLFTNYNTKNYDPQSDHLKVSTRDNGYEKVIQILSQDPNMTKYDRLRSFIEFYEYNGSSVLKEAVAQ